MPEVKDHLKYSKETGRKIVDVRKVLPTLGTYKVRTLPLTSIAVHHSLTKSGSAAAFARYHTETLGWPGIGYTYVIRKDGTVDWCHDRDRKTYHVGKFNLCALGICLIGDFRTEEPTAEQLSSLAALCRDILSSEKTISVIQGHSDYPGYEWKACPAFSVADFLRANSLEEYLRQ